MQAKYAFAVCLLIAMQCSTNRLQQPRYARVDIDQEPGQLGPWQCHVYQNGQNNVWCAAHPIENHVEYNFTRGGGQCGPCWCCKRINTVPTTTTTTTAQDVRVGIVQSQAAMCPWRCHSYEQGQNNDWCRSNPVADGIEFLFTQGDGTCGPCWCCSRAAPAQAPARNKIFYALFVRHFSPSGTFHAVEQRVADLSALGVQVVWFMPIHPIGIYKKGGSYGSPYAVRDYFDVHPDQGTLDDFRALVRTLHSHSIECILDLVAGHTSWDHPWIRQHPDWYTQDMAGNIVGYSNHPEWKDIARLNYANAGLRAEMYKVMRFWIEDVGVDGFRADYASSVPLDFWTTAIAGVRALRSTPLIMLAEGSKSDLYDVGFDLTYDWRGYDALKKIFWGTYAEDFAEIYSCDSDRDKRLRFSWNHDKPLPAQVFHGLDGALSSQLVMSFLPGAVLIYNSQEVGSTQQLSIFDKVSVDWALHPEVRRWYTDLLHARSTHQALSSGVIHFQSSSHLLVAEKTVSNSRALLVVNVQCHDVVVDLSSWSNSSFRELFTGEVMRRAWPLAAYKAVLFLT